MIRLARSMRPTFILFTVRRCSLKPGEDGLEEIEWLDGHGRATVTGTTPGHPGDQGQREHSSQLLHSFVALLVLAADTVIAGVSFRNVVEGMERMAGRRWKSC